MREICSLYRAGWFERSLVISGFLLILLGFIGAGLRHSDAVTTTIQAHIQGVRYVVVDSNQIITEVYSNTPHAVTPVVLFESVDGSTIPITPAVQKQYQLLVARHDWSKIRGKVYQRPLPVSAFRDSQKQVGSTFIKRLEQAAIPLVHT